MSEPILLGPVYLAHPYTSDPDKNVRQSMEITQKMLDNGIAVINPLLTHFHEMKHPNNYEKYMAMDFTIILGCKAVFANMDGESEGRDREISYALSHKIEVYQFSYENKDNRLYWSLDVPVDMFIRDEMRKYRKRRIAEVSGGF